MFLEEIYIISEETLDICIKLCYNYRYRCRTFSAPYSKLFVKGNTMNKLLVVTTALLLPVAAAYGAAQIFEGEWPDGNKIEWICPPKTSGTIPFRFTTPEGSVYRGVLVCGVSA